MALRIVVIVLKINVFFLLIFGLGEVFMTLFGILNHINHNNEALLVGVLVATLVPAGGVLYWGCKAMSIQLEEPMRLACRYFRSR